MSRPTFSIVSSWFNVERMQFAWRQALENWLAFLQNDGQIVIAINTSEDDSPRIVREWVAKWQAEHPHSSTRIDVLDIAIPYTNPAFDGMGKAAATAAATEPYVILLDADERLVPTMRRKWDVLARELEASPYEAFFVPVLDLIGDEQHYRMAEGQSHLASKWYLHKRLPYLTRGVVAEAYNPDGVTWNTSRSDSCELLDSRTGQLAYTAAIVSPAFPHYLLVPQMESGEIPFVAHLGWLDAEQRLRQSEFWRPHWDARAGQPGKEPTLTLEALAAMPRYHHNLPSWREGMER